MLLQRFVIDVDVAPDGRLTPRPAATWRSEPARGEGTIHRRLADLVGAPGARIAAFASVHGFLRRHAGGVIFAAGPASTAATLAVGQEAADDAVRVQEWLERGAVGPPPHGTEDTIAQVALYAGLSDPILEAFDAFFDGTAEATAIAPSDFIAIAARMLPAVGPAARPFLTNPERIRDLDPARVRRGLRINEWASRVVGGLEEPPAALVAVGGADAFLREIAANMPEAIAIPELLGGPDGRATAYMLSLATETIDDWRTVAREIRSVVHSLNLIRGALRPTGLSLTEKRDLTSLYTDLAAYHSPVRLSAAEIADRARGLLAVGIESDLAALGAWPLRRGALAGLYVRALVAAWTELTETSPPKACATPGCLRAAPPTRNRRYCEPCQASRRRESVRHIRSRATPAEGSS